MSGGGASLQAMIQLTEALSASGDDMAISDLATRLGLPRSTLYAVVRTMLDEGLLDASGRGRVRLSRAWLDFPVDPSGMAADRTVADSRHPEPVPKLAPVARSFLWNPVLTGVVDCHRFRRAAPYRIGFSNGSRSNHWRLALIDAVLRTANDHSDVASVVVRNADDDDQQQARDLQELVDNKVDILLVSPVSRQHLSATMAAIAGRGMPIVVVDRAIDDEQAYVTHIFSADASIGRIPALWLVERLRGTGGVVLLGGMQGTTPVEQRMSAALEVFDIHPAIDVLDIAYTGWTRHGGRQAMASAIERFGDRITGVWCDSGQQGVGSLDAFIDAGLSGRIPPHTGGDLNAMYKRSLELGVPVAALDYPPAMGSRAVEACVDILSGGRVLRQIEMPCSVVVSRGAETPSVHADIYVDDHVRWDQPDTFIMGQLPAAGGHQRAPPPMAML